MIEALANLGLKCTISAQTVQGYAPVGTIMMDKSAGIYQLTTPSLVSFDPLASEIILFAQAEASVNSTALNMSIPKIIEMPISSILCFYLDLTDKGIFALRDYINNAW